MYSNSLRLSVVIPTRERAGTLLATLKTVVTQDYKNLQIVVSDNNSVDNTKEVVESFHDPRIVYTNTGRRLGMSSNWEHGLSYVDGDYVMFLGDDDGLLPNACSDVALILCKLKSDALIWLKPDYNWPCSFSAANKISIKFGNSILRIKSKMVLRAMAYGYSGYGRLPIIYSGFVSTSVIRQVIKKTGKFFCSVTPDIYSGIAIASQIGYYHYSLRPFSINGGSSQSNGQSINRSDSFSKIFFEESDLSINKKIPVIRGSMHSSVAEAFLQAQELELIGKPKLKDRRYFELIFADLARLRNIEAREKGFTEFCLLDIPSSLRKRVKTIELTSANVFINNMQAPPEELICTSALILQNGHIDLDASKFNVFDVFDACRLISNILGIYVLPKNVKRVNLLSLLLTRIDRFMKEKFSPHSLDV